MDIGGINRIKGPVGPVTTKTDRGLANATDRDAQGHAGYQKQKAATQLTPEQEQEALKKLNEMPAFSQAGLRAELVKGEGIAAHIVVKKSNGEVLRHLPYEQIVEIYVNRHVQNATGRLLKSAA